MKVDLEELVKEAEREYRRYHKAFHKYDNYDDMREMEFWSSVKTWLSGKRANEST